MASAPLRSKGRDHRSTVIAPTEISYTSPVTTPQVYEWCDLIGVDAIDVSISVGIAGNHIVQGQPSNRDGEEALDFSIDIQPSIRRDYRRYLSTLKEKQYYDYHNSQHQQRHHSTNHTCILCQNQVSEGIIY